MANLTGFGLPYSSRKFQIGAITLIDKKVLTLFLFLVARLGKSTVPFGRKMLIKKLPQLVRSSSSKVWKLPPTKRGLEIEIIRAGPNRLPGNFPVVDIYRNGTAISVKSLDLSRKTYQGRRLFSKLKQYIDHLIDFRGASVGLRRVPGNARKELEVVIPKGLANPQQRQLLDEAVDYGRLNNITVRIIEM